MCCPNCNSTDIVKNGKRNRNIRTKQSYLCNNCNKQFIEQDNFQRMRFNPKIILKAIQLQKSGNSLSKIQSYLSHNHNINVSRWTIAKWTKKYEKAIK